MFGGCILTKDFSFLRGAMVVCAVLCILISASGQTMKPPLVRIAELEIDPAQLTAYRDALKEEIAAFLDDPGRTCTSKRTPAVCSFVERPFSSSRIVPTPHRRRS